MTRSPLGPYFTKSRRYFCGFCPCSGGCSCTRKPWMYPSLSRILAISAFNFEAGISTRACLAIVALRIRASMSAIGSVIVHEPCMDRPHLTPPVILPPRVPRTPPGLPTALDDAGNVTLERELPEAQPTERELPDEPARPAAQLASVPVPDRELQRLQFPRHLRGRCHIVPVC